MTADILPLRNSSEKVTINLGYVDLGQIDLLVQEGFYSNRTDFIRSAVRHQLLSHIEETKKAAVRHTLEIGVLRFGRVDLEAAKANGNVLNIQVLGLAVIDNDVTPDLAKATIGAITVLGALHATPEVRAALADRIH